MSRLPCFKRPQGSFSHAVGAVLFSALALSCGDAQSAAPRPVETTTPSPLEPALQQAFARATEVSVIVNFREPETRNKGRAGRSAAIRGMQEQLLAIRGAGFRLSRRYAHVPALAATVTKSEAERLLLDANVSSVQLDGAGSGQLKEATAAAGADMVKSIYGLTGKGVRVAFLDSGAATTHPDLMSSIVAQQCFTRNACPPRRTPTGTSAEDDHGHGSHTTGIVTSDGKVAPPGFAPEAEIVAVKVNDQNDSGMESDWVAGLDWVYENLDELKVRIVNMSLGTTAMHRDTAECDRAHPAMTRAIANLTEAGVVVFAATGNVGSSTMMASPACNSGPITVGATYDAKLGHQPPGAATYFDRWGASFGRCGDDATDVDQITCFTNSTARMDLVAPGAPVVSAALRGRTDTYFGTSQAAPAAAGVAALMLECNPSLTPAQIKEHLVSTGVKVLDKRNNLMFPSLRALAAVRAACPQLADGGDGGAPGSGSDAGAGSEDGGSTPAASADGGARVNDAGARSDGGRRDAGRATADARADEGDDDRGDDDTADDDTADDDSADEDDDFSQSEDPAEADDDRGKGAGQGGSDGGCSLTHGTGADGWLTLLLGLALARITRRRGARLRA